ncbi:MAG: ribonuclease H [Gemmatimonadales bacterium]
MADANLPFALVHADESCLGNDQEGEAPGGAASLIEVRSGNAVARRDVYISSPATTNNRMALNGAIATLVLLAGKGNRLRVVFVSDSEYLVKGATEWMPAWRTRGWRRKKGEVMNLKLWKTLDRVGRKHAVTWRWTRGHAGDPKNEYVNDLAVRAARDQIHSQGAVASEFMRWLDEHKARGRYVDYDPDRTFAQFESQMAYDP